VRQHGSFGGAASPFVTNVSDIESTDPGDVQLLNRSNPFFMDH